MQSGKSIVKSFIKLKQSIDNDYNISRITFLIISGLLLMASTTAWNTLGYLSPYAWFLEWSDVILSFACIYYAVQKYRIRPVFIYTLITVTLIFCLLSYLPVLEVSLPKTVSPASFLIYVLLVPVAIFVLISIGKTQGSPKATSVIVLVSVLAMLGFIAYSFYTVNPRFPTDESVFDLYSAHLFLSGANPYNSSLMSGAFAYYGFPLNANSPITPLTTGGFVQSITYPALSFLIFVPAEVLHINVSLFILPFFAMPVLVVWYSSWSRKHYLYSALLLLPIVSVVIFAYQAGSAYTDVFWATFTMISFYLLPRVKASGVFYGLALSVKQFPIIAAPFLIYYIFREHGKSKLFAWTLLAAVSFLAVNGYFLALNPAYFVKSMVANELSPLIGIGYGPAQLSFLGIVPVSRTVFSILMITAFLISLVFYILKYGKVKYLLFAFPILIFLFNYRLFVQYLYFWLFITLIPVQGLFLNPGKKEEKHKGPAFSFKPKPVLKYASIAIISLILVGAGFSILHETSTNQGNRIIINSVAITGLNSTGYINSMDVGLDLHDSGANMTHLYFRIITPGPVANGNMLLWKAANSTRLLNSGQNTLNIVPDYPGLALNRSTGFKLIAYFGSVQGSYFQSSWNA